MRSNFTYQELLKDLKKVQNFRFQKVTQTTSFGKQTKFGKSNEKLANDVEHKIEQLPLKKQNTIKKYFIKMLVAIGYKIGDLIDFTLKEIISLVIQHFGKIVLAAIMVRYGMRITKSINDKVVNVGDKFKKK